MGTKRKPKFDDVIDGERVRVFATRSEYEAFVGDGDPDDADADVWVFPKVGTPDVWAKQARMNHNGK